MPRQKRVAIVLNGIDNVAAALTDLSASDQVEVGIDEGKKRTIELKDNIQLGHKFAITSIESGADIRKYGLSIGPATRDIQVGEHVHTHNVLDSDDDGLVQNVGKTTE